MKKALVILLLPLLGLFSCSIQKRKFQKGYYVSWHHSSTQDSQEHSKPAVTYKTKEAITPPLSPVKAEEPEPSLSASGKKEFSPVDVPKQKNRLVSEPDSCDEITFQNGDVTKAKVLEITTTEVKYKKCSLPDGPLFISRKSEIFMLKYANGTRETFPKEIPGNSNDTKTDYRQKYDQRERHPDASWVLLMGIAGLLIGYGSISAIIVGSRVLREMRGDPYRYKGEGMVKTGMALGIAKLAIVALYIVLIVGLLLL